MRQRAGCIVAAVGVERQGIEAMDQPMHRIGERVRHPFFPVPPMEAAGSHPQVDRVPPPDPLRESLEFLGMQVCFPRKHQARFNSRHSNFRPVQGGLFMKALFAAALCVFSLSGCVTTNASMLGTASTHRPAVLPENVALYRSADQVPRRYEEVALLNSEGDSDVTDEVEMFESMKEKAGELGANAIILEALIEPSGGAKVAAEIFGVSAQRKGRAVAIYVFPAGAP